MRSIFFTSVLIIFYLINQYTCSLGDNLIINSRFSQPDLISQGIYLQQIPTSIPGWNCTHLCEINNCKLLNSIFLNVLSMPVGDCDGQVLDMSSDRIEAISQTIKADSGNYLLQVQFLSPMPVSNIQEKIILIYLNQQLIYSLQPQTISSFPLHNFTTIVELLQGNNNLTLTMGGLNDGCGFRLVSVSVRKIIDEEDSTISSFFGNMAMEGVIGVPGARFMLGYLMNAFVSLDRLQLYYYHNRNYSHFSNLILKSISTFQDAKGQLTLKAEAAVYGHISQIQQDYISSLDFKYSYIYPEIIQKSQNGYSLIANNANLFVYSFPFFVASLAIFYLIFRLIHQDHLSIIFRKYSFFVTSFLLMVCEGNIEQYSFYAFGEFSIFFSATFKHKIVNFFLIAFFFLVLFTAVALYFSFWGWEHRKVRYFAENGTISLKGILCCTIDRGIICIVLGAVHSLLLPLPRLQLFLLFLIETTWIGMKLFGLSRHAYERSTMTWLEILDGLNRIFFQLTIWLYSQSLGSARDSNFINSQVHLSQIYVMIAVWTATFLASLWIFVEDLVDLSKKSKEYQKKKSVPLPTIGAVVTKHNQNIIQNVEKPHKSSLILQQKKKENKMVSRFYLIFRRDKLFMSNK